MTSITKVGSMSHLTQLIQAPSLGTESDMEIWRVQYPATPIQKKHVTVAPGIQLYVEESGNPNGIPVIFIHGGPGIEFKSADHLWFDPKIYRIIVFQQRGTKNCIPSAFDSSTPSQIFRDVRIKTLAEDIEALRKELNVDQWLVFGGSWGSTLSIYYGQEFPSSCLGLVVRGVFLATHEENRIFLDGEKHAKQHGAKWKPEALTRLVSYAREKNFNVDLKDTTEIYAAYRSMCVEQNDATAQRIWTAFENFVDDPEDLAEFNRLMIDGEETLPSDRSTGIWETLLMDSVAREYNLLDKARLAKLKDVPVQVVQGEKDNLCKHEIAENLVKGLRQIGCPVEYDLIEGGPHSPYDPGMTHALIQATDRFAKSYQTTKKGSFTLESLGKEGKEIQESLRVGKQQMHLATVNLARLVAIDSVSNQKDPGYSPKSLGRAASFVEESLKGLGFATKSVCIKDSPPFVIGKKVYDIAKSTVLFYGHYDVQPANRSEWKTNPFKLEEKEGRLYGRGASDDKAGIIAITTALKVLKEAGVEPDFNVTVLFEGEEEFDSTHMQGLVEQEKDLLKSDALIVVDGANKSVDIGTLQDSTRGLLIMALRVSALKEAVHSGLGVLVPNPAHAMLRLYTSLLSFQEQGNLINRKSSYNEPYLQSLDNSSISDEEYKQQNGVLEDADLQGPFDESIYRRIAVRDSLHVMHIDYGVAGGNKISPTATCTFEIRLTNDQNPDEVEKTIRTFIASQKVMHNLQVALTREDVVFPWKADVEKPYSQRFLRAMREVYPSTAIVPSGGSIPLYYDFKHAFPETEMMLVGVEDPETAAHVPNESQSKLVLRRTINSIIGFLTRN